MHVTYTAQNKNIQPVQSFTESGKLLEIAYGCAAHKAEQHFYKPGILLQDSSPVSLRMHETLCTVAKLPTRVGHKIGWPRLGTILWVLRG